MITNDMLPTLGTNGTGRSTLLSEVEEAMQSLQLAAESLRQITVNARDYEQYGRPESDRAAMTEWVADSTATIRKIYDDLAELWNYIADGGHTVPQ